jgi:hypothetical protein
MTIENFSSASESNPNQEQVSVTREDDGSLSISVDALATASADGGSSSETVSGTQQAKSNMDGTDTTYPTDQAGESDVSKSNDEAVLTAIEDLSAKLGEVIELLGGLSDDNTVGKTQSLVNEPPAEPSSVDAGSSDDQLMGLLEGVLADVEQVIEMLGGDDSAVSGTANETDMGSSVISNQDSEGPQKSREEYLGGVLTDYFFGMDAQGQAEVIDMLSSGDFGEDGVKIAKELQGMLDNFDGGYFPSASASSSTINQIMADSDEASAMINAVESIYDENRNLGGELISSFTDIFVSEDSEKQAEVIDVLSSGQFGEDGKKIAELIPNLITSFGPPDDEIMSFDEEGNRIELGSYPIKYDEDVYNEIMAIMYQSGEAEEINAAVNSIVSPTVAIESPTLSL